MGLLRDFLRFVKAAGRLGVGLMTGGLVAYVAGLYEHVSGKSLSAALWVGLGSLLFLAGSFLAWRREERTHIQAEKSLEEAINKDRSEVFVTLDFGPYPHIDRQGGSLVSLQNHGKNRAYNVQISPINIADKILTFPCIQSIENRGGKEQPRYWINGYDYDSADALVIVLKNLCNTIRQKELAFTMEVSWVDSSGNKFHSSSNVTYEHRTEKCRTFTGPVVHDTST